MMICEEFMARDQYQQTGVACLRTWTDDQRRTGAIPCATADSADKVVAVGSPRGTIDMDFLKDVHLREVSIHGAHHPKTPNDDHIYYRWTKTRERALVLRLMAAGRLPLSHLITHEFAPHECQQVYRMLADDPKDVLGVLFGW
jgi:threonine dehydrogenase-like Zn-dependent dehydrogenase